MVKWIPHTKHEWWQALLFITKASLLIVMMSGLLLFVNLFHEGKSECQFPIRLSPFKYWYFHIIAAPLIPAVMIAVIKKRIKTLILWYFVYLIFFTVFEIREFR